MRSSLRRRRSASRADKLASTSPSDWLLAEFTVSVSVQVFDQQPLAGWSAAADPSPPARTHELAILRALKTAVRGKSSLPPHLPDVDWEKEGKHQDGEVSRVQSTSPYVTVGGRYTLVGCCHEKCFSPTRKLFGWLCR